MASEKPQTTANSFGSVTWGKNFGKKKPRRIRRDGITEKCEYCGYCYHPMPRYTKGDEMIVVCQSFVSGNDRCEKRAKINGWTRRPDLTPSR